MEKTLVYLGVNQGMSFRHYRGKFDRAYGFEAIPELAKKLKDEFKDDDKVSIINKAVCDKNEKVKFYISNQSSMQSSSMGQLNDYYRSNGPKGKIYNNIEIEIEGINLLNFLEENNIEYIDTYVSDLEGMDFTVLKTIKPYIDNKKIRRIEIEAEMDYYESASRDGIPSNKVKEIKDFLSENYNFVGMLKGNYDPNAEDRWFNTDLYFELK